MGAAPIENNVMNPTASQLFGQSRRIFIAGVPQLVSDIDDDATSRAPLHHHFRHLVAASTKMERTNVVTGFLRL